MNFEVCKPATKRQILVWFHYLYEVPGVIKLIETESRTLVAWGNGSYSLVGGVSAEEYEKVTVMDGGDGCTIMRMYLMPHN